MDSRDVSAAIQPLLDGQIHATRRVQERKVWLAKVLLVFATALFSTFATYTAQRYLASGEVEPTSLVVLTLLVAAVRNRWRAA